MFIFPDNERLFTCYGQSCKHRTDRFGDKTNYFESPGYPRQYQNRNFILYMLYIPGVNLILFEFDPLAYGLEDYKDIVEVGPGLEYDWSDPTKTLYVFSDMHATVSRGNGVFTPRSFTIQSDSVWMVFSTDRNVIFSGWRLYWSIPGRLYFQIITLISICIFFTHWLFNMNKV